WVFTACTVALIFLLGARYFSRGIGIAAALIYMCDPVVVYAAWTPISESLFMLFFLGSIYVLGARSRRAWILYVLAGFLFALSIYVRPAGLYLTPIVACFALAHTP